MKLEEKLKPGNKLQIFYGGNSANNKTIHIRGVVDDHIIFRYWLKHKKYWKYQAEPACYFKYKHDEILKYLGKSK